MEITGEIEHEFREWSIFGIDQENNLEEVLEIGPDCCIYRIPHFLRKINEEAYTPKLISIGPLHYGKEVLMGMENQKKRYWPKFWERVKNAQEILEEFKTYIKNQEQCIRGHYSVTSKLKSLVYIKMILRDVVFIIELFLREYTIVNDDFLLKPPLQFYIAADLLLLENQIPYFVFNDLFMKAFPDEANLSFFILHCCFFGMSFSEEQLKVKHFTDSRRNDIVMEVQTMMQSKRRKIFDLPSATKLKESGLKFRGMKNKKCFLDISLVKRKSGKWLSWFEGSELQIPSLKIYDTTEGLFRNVMALEMFHYPTQTCICNYAFLMDYLIDTTKDVDLLVEKGIIVNCVGDNEAIAKMFNRLCLYIRESDSCYYDMAEEMKAHYKYLLNHLKATLKSVYFSNPWTSTATIAATSLLILTSIQTFYSIK